MKSILLVEDDWLSQMVVENVFEVFDIPVKLVCVESAEEALAQIAALDPLLVLMDIRLPGIDGFAATKAIKQDPATKHIPVWAMTALNGQDDIDAAVEAGCSGYFVKPVDARLLASKIESLVDSLPIGGFPLDKGAIPVWESRP